MKNKNSMKYMSNKKESNASCQASVANQTLASHRVLSRINFLQSFVVVGMSPDDVRISVFVVDFVVFLNRNISISLLYCCSRKNVRFNKLNYRFSYCSLISIFIDYYLWRTISAWTVEPVQTWFSWIICFPTIGNRR